MYKNGEKIEHNPPSSKLPFKVDIKLDAYEGFEARPNLTKYFVNLEEARLYAKTFRRSRISRHGVEVE